MSDRDPRRELEEFVDGRLPADRRRAFEERLGDDPELRREVAARLEIRRALLDDDVEVSPGFHTRARARFEQRRRRPLRLVSWEVAGLAAAVALAGLFFIPSLLDRRLPADVLGKTAALDPVQEGGRTVPASPDPTRKNQVAQAEIERQPAAAKIEALTGTESLEEVEADEQFKLGEPVDSDEGAESKEGVGLAERVDPNDRFDAGDVMGEASPRARDAREELGDAVSPEGAVAAPKEAFEDRALNEPRVVAAEPGDAPSTRGAKKRKADTLRSQVAAPTPAPARFLPLPQGAIEAGGFRIVSDPASLRRLGGLEGLEGFADTDDGAMGTRVALIGPRERSFSCSEITVVDAGNWVEVRLHGAGAASAARWGCAVVLADDGREVRLVTSDGGGADD